MSTNRKIAETLPIDPDFLITDDVGGPDTIVERVLTVDSVPLPGTSNTQVERIQISEKVIPLPSAQHRQGQSGQSRSSDRSGGGNAA